MKTLKQFINEVAGANSPDEERFISKHHVVVFDYSFGNENAMNGNVSKDFSRLADYKWGADTMVYEGTIELKKEDLPKTIEDAEAKRHKALEIYRKIIEENVETEEEIASLLEDFDAETLGYFEEILES